MPDYHPLDTRYKGPSTAYRGSAKWTKPPRTKNQVTTTATAKTGKAAPPPSPWGSKRQDTVPSPIPAASGTAPHDTAATITSMMRSTFKTAGQTVRMVRNAYLVFVGAIFLIIFLSSAQGSILGSIFGPAEMVSINSR